MTAVSVSTRSAQSTFRMPEVIQLASTGAVKGAPVKPTRQNTVQDSRHEMNSSVVVTISLGRGPNWRPNRPAIRKPRRGRKTIAEYMFLQPFIILMSSTAIVPRLRK